MDEQRLCQMKGCQEPATRELDEIDSVFVANFCGRHYFFAKTLRIGVSITITAVLLAGMAGAVLVVFEVLA